MFMRLTFVLLLFWGYIGTSVLILPAAYAQERPNFLLRVEMKDGSVFIGVRLAMTDDELILDTESLGKINLPLAGIREIRELDAPPGRFRYGNVAANQNILGPNAFGLRKGQKQYSNFMLGYNQMAFGLSDRFSLYAGIEVFSLLVGIAEGDFIGPGMVLRPHFSFPLKQDKLTFGCGVLAGGIVGTGDGAFGLAPYGSIAVGDKDRNLNVNFGIGIGGGSVSPPFFAVNGNLRLTPGFGLNMENWIFPGRFETAIANSIGVRIYGERISWNIALLGAGSDFGYTLLPVPLGGLTVSF